jgi:two-component system chemotaxis response regulator CheB
VRRFHRRPEKPVPAADSRRVRIVAIGASTGGPPAVAAVLRQLPKRVPVLVVQHIAPGFVASFAEWLRVETGFATRIPVDDQPLCPGTAYIAPEGAHMGIAGPGRIVLSKAPQENGFRPSICHLFRTVASVFGSSAAGVLLTGMGCDGAEGLKVMRDAGAVTFAQAEASCAVFGMPCEAIRRGAAQHTLGPAEIGTMVRGLLADQRGRD